MTDKTLKLSLRNTQAIRDKDSDLLLPTATKKSRRVKRKLLKRKIQHNWKEEEINRLIAAVEMEPSIWMEGPLQYKSARKHCWNAVVAQLAIADVDVNEAKTKWSSLRVTFRLNLSKMNNASSTNGNAVVWRYFNQMSFLNSSCQTHQSNVLLKEELTTPVQSPLPTADKRRRTRGHPDCSYSTLLPAAMSLSSETPASAPASISPRPAPAPAPANSLLLSNDAPASPESSSSPAARLSTPALAPLSHVSAVLNDGADDGCSKADANAAFCDYLLSEMRTLSTEEARALRQHLTRTLLNFMERVLET
ncbi:PREDICTED: uncharacterized protein LOC108618880 [Drosophila arizonae]|uniref:Uncharacterized protein LOC108618880 n=1 Tax=Drosophila arizonae TaxID=7263 RepID=A0ABM1PTN3_DROAR|nr:PREDICTED: uncharacterized protein LOC108618880 [Drosophila arizonae]